MIQTLNEQKKGNQRRVIKSHLPADCVPISPDVRYIFVGRNGKDILCSFHNYLKNFNKETLVSINELYSQHFKSNEKMIIPEICADFFDLLLDTNGYKCYDLFDVTLSWWNLRKLSNVLMLHYSQLLQDMENQIKTIAAFIGMDPLSLDMQKIKEHCEFGYMKQRSEKLVPFSGKHMTSSKAFFHKGPERDHKSDLSIEQISRYDKMAYEKMGEECCQWLETGTQ